MWWLLVQAAVAGPWHFGASVGGGGGLQMAPDTWFDGQVEVAAELERDFSKASLYLSLPVRLSFEEGGTAVLSGLHFGALARLGKRPVHALVGGGGALLGGAFPGGSFASRAFAEGRFGVEYDPGKGPAWQLWVQPEIGAAPNLSGVAPYTGLQVRTGIRF